MGAPRMHAVDRVRGVRTEYEDAPGNTYLLPSSKCFFDLSLASHGALGAKVASPALRLVRA
jgi:hypothetical protein